VPVGGNVAHTATTALGSLPLPISLCSSSRFRISRSVIISRFLNAGSVCLVRIDFFSWFTTIVLSLSMARPCNA
jgi:hypothetical protein